MWNRVLCRPFGKPFLARHAAAALALIGAALVLGAALGSQATAKQKALDHAARCKARGFGQGRVSISKSYDPILFCVDGEHRVYWMD